VIKDAGTEIFIIRPDAPNNGRCPQGIKVWVLTLTADGSACVDTGASLLEHSCKEKKESHVETLRDSLLINDIIM